VVVAAARGGIMKNMADKIFVAVVSVFITAVLWFAFFYATGSIRTNLLIDILFMAVLIPLKLFESKKRREGKEIRSVVFKRGASKRPLVIGALFGALFWWLAFRFLPHLH
jgi:hypothetical protein